MTRLRHHRERLSFGPSVLRICSGFRILDFGFAARGAFPVAAFLAVLAAGGCAGPDETISLRRQLIEAQDGLRKAQDENLALHGQLRSRDEQIKALQALGAGKRLEKLFTVKRIQIGSYTGGVDTDGKPGDDGVKVLLEPRDAQDSTIKAAGDVTVQLYDLAAPPAQNLLAACHYTPEELAGKWTNGFLSQYFIFECPWGRNVPRHNQITVRVTFVDYLTGLSFTDQKVVTVALPPATQPAAQASSAPAQN